MYVYYTYTQFIAVYASFDGVYLRALFFFYMGSIHIHGMYVCMCIIHIQIYCTCVSRGNKRDRDHRRGETRHGHIISVCVNTCACKYIFGTYISRGKKKTVIIGGGKFDTVMQFMRALVF